VAACRFLNLASGAPDRASIKDGPLAFVLVAGFVGMCNLASAWRNNGLRNSVLSHTATDACGVIAARLRLGMDVADAGA
jgi:hypothetical protein